MSKTAAKESKIIEVNGTTVTGLTADPIVCDDEETAKVIAGSFDLRNALDTVVEMSAHVNLHQVGGDDLAGRVDAAKAALEKTK